MTCLIEDCENPVYSRGYCNKHYIKFRRDGTLPLKQNRHHHVTCNIEGCDKRATSKGYCNRHYQHYLRGVL